MLDYTQQTKDMLVEMANLKQAILEYVQNGQNSFYSRWAAFKNYYALGGNTVYWGFSGWDHLPLFPTRNFRGEISNQLSWYDDFNVERRETVDLVDHGMERIFDKVLEADPEMSHKWGLYCNGDANPLDGVAWALYIYKHPIVIQAAEALMQSGVTHFNYDW